MLIAMSPKTTAEHTFIVDHGVYATLSFLLSSQGILDEVLIFAHGRPLVSGFPPPPHPQ